ncbi:MAG: hypothetical protein AUI36_33480 [Cyanobacteria bacterium 13_1_40CM_2_61_4]|nr:MAG: hypothetical protein AUI36_33480 [Cyanobacteria bacterium 13_1_40CM_2_61_4]
MLRTVVDVTSLTLAWLKRSRRLRFGGACVKVNLGSALAVARGWINVDGSLNAFFAGAPSWLLRSLYRWSGSRAFYSREEYCNTLRANRFLHHNFSYSLPLADESVHYIYSSHLLEHLFRDEAQRLLGDCHRVLKRGGWLRVCVPDLEYAVSLFGRGEKIKALEFFFSQARAGQLNRHQYMYDFSLLGGALQVAGFVNITRCTFRKGHVPDVEVLDNRPHETLYVEAQKE